jgi:hypothetical protein
MDSDISAQGVQMLDGGEETATRVAIRLGFSFCLFPCSAKSEKNRGVVQCSHYARKVLNTLKPVILCIFSFGSLTGQSAKPRASSKARRS